MPLFTNELIKLRSAPLAVVIVLLPLVAVGLGAGNYAANAETLTGGWESYWSQVVLFYGLLFMTLGIAVLATAVWRFEHLGHNWNALMTAPVARRSVVWAKLGALTVLVTALQVVFVAVALGVGLALRVPGELSVGMIAASALAIVPGVAVAAWQSLLSMIVRNVALPVAAATLGCILGTGLLAGENTTASLFVAPALLTSTLQLGSTAMANAGTLAAATVLPLLAASLLSALVATLLASVYLNRADVRS